MPVKFYHHYLKERGVHALSESLQRSKSAVTMRPF